MILLYILFGLWLAGVVVLAKEAIAIYRQQKKLRKQIKKAVAYRPLHWN